MSTHITFTVPIGENDAQEIAVTLHLPTLTPLPEDDADCTAERQQDYERTAIALHAMVIACPNLCGYYAVVTPQGMVCPHCGPEDFPFLGHCQACTSYSAPYAEDIVECLACGEYAGNSDGLIVKGNRKTGEIYERRDTVEEAMERYYETPGIDESDEYFADSDEATDW